MSYNEHERESNRNKHGGVDMVVVITTKASESDEGFQFGVRLHGFKVWSKWGW